MGILESLLILHRQSQIPVRLEIKLHVPFPINPLHKDLQLIASAWFHPGIDWAAGKEIICNPFPGDVPFPH